MKICPDVVFPNNFSFCFMAPPVAYGPSYVCVTASSYQIHMVKSKDMHQEEKIVEFYKKIV